MKRMVLGVFFLLLCSPFIGQSVFADDQIRYEFNFEGSTEHTQGGKWFNSTEGVSSFYAASAKVIPPYDGYITRVEVRLGSFGNGPGQSAYFDEYDLTGIYLDSSEQEVGSSMYVGDIASFEWSGFPNPVVHYGTDYWNRWTFDTYWELPQSPSPLVGGTPVWVTLRFAAIDTGWKGVVGIMETTGSGTQTDVHAHDNNYPPYGWKYTSDVSGHMHDGRLAVNVYFAPAATPTPTPTPTPTATPTATPTPTPTATPTATPTSKWRRHDLRHVAAYRWIDYYLVTPATPCWLGHNC